MKVFFSIIFGLIFCFALGYTLMLLGLEFSVEVFNPDPSMYEDEDASSGIYLSSVVLTIIFIRYSYLAMDQKTFKIKYGQTEKDGTIAWIKTLILFALLTTPFDLLTGYYIKSSGINFLSHLWYIFSGLICWYFFGRKYFNPLSN
ncbi:hypothetical protein IDH01_05700 [Pelagibacterales bacterium SAG-MED08]|nr:hypothetical protein [Pelagibacterales bacterium SAG-MED08]